MPRPEQLTFTFDQAGVKPPTPPPAAAPLAKVRVPAAFLPPDDRPRQYTGRQQVRLFDQYLAEALAEPDPLEQGTPGVGSQVQVLWRGWPDNPWELGTVIRADSMFLTVKMHFDSRCIWTVHVSRAVRARSPNNDKGPLWRWPRPL